MTLNSEMRALATELIEEFGTAATLYYDSGAFDAETNTRAAGEGSEVVRVSDPIGKIREFPGDGNTMHDGLEVRYLSAESLTTVPTAGMRLVVGSVSRRITSVETFEVSGAAAAYALRLS